MTRRCVACERGLGHIHYDPPPMWWLRRLAMAAVEALVFVTCVVAVFAALIIISG